MTERRKRLLSVVLARSVTELVRAACILALMGLAVMIYPLLSPGALTIILSMSIGHAIGIAAASLYLLAVILDMARRRDH